MRKLFLSFVALVCAGVMLAELPVMTFTESRYNFGQIQEADGSATHEFLFINEGEETLVIKNIRPSCKWITATVSDSILEPGEFGTATIIYYADGHLGKFAKTVSFTTNAKDSIARLFVLGEVLPKGLLKVGSYPYRIGPLSTKRADADFGVVYKGSSDSIVIEYANSTAKALDLEILAPEKQKFITVNVSRQHVAPNEEGTITIKFDTDKCRIWGEFAAKLSVLINGENDTQNDIKLTVVIEEDFSQLTPEELKAAPVFALTDTVFDFGKVKAGNELAKKISFKNSGKNPLELRRIQVLGGKMLKVAPETKEATEGGKKNALICTITTPKKVKASREFTRTIKLITNDPNRVYNTITVKWTVEP